MGPPNLPWLFYVVLSLFSGNTFFSLAASFISSNQSLTGNQTITSDGGNFVLGFFSPGNSTNFYIGIWYKKVYKQTVVWVANRESPLTDPSSSELKLSGDGNLVLLNQFKVSIWSTNTSITSSNTTVVELLDTGNLVLRDGYNSSIFFWQSFDHPTDAWLPGMKIGLNKVTKKTNFLTSWKSLEDPALGIYSVELDPDGSNQYVLRWKRSKIYWKSGTWDGQMFKGIPEMSANPIYNFQHISNDNENYFTYSVRDNSSIKRFVLTLSGQMRHFTWFPNSQDWNLFGSMPRAQCDVYSLCGSFGICNEKSLPYCTCLNGFRKASPENWSLSDQTSGCVRNTPLQCFSNGDQDKFYTMSNMKMPDNAQFFAVASAEQCKSSCLSNCSCTAYSYDNSCSLWYGGLLNQKQLISDGVTNGGTLQLRLAASELPTSHSKRVIIWTVFAVVSGLLALSAAVWLLVWIHHEREFSKLKVVDGILVSFKYNHLRRATKNFSNKLGTGGFGSVFKGALPDSTLVAVKKLEGINQGEKQFRAEVSTIGTIQHVNLVRLHGFCSEGANRLLVYDYMPWGSLDAAMFRSSSTLLDWSSRYRIALGIARGLAYLHERCRDCILHCDIKPENILLDASFTPKVADFGLAKLLGRDFSRVITTMRGTVGYLAPEWIMGTPITAKADVYSFGMVLLEIVSGRRNTEPTGVSPTGDRRSVYFPSWTMHKLMEGEVLSLLDPRLEGVANLKELDRVCRIACWCIQDDELSRPSMGLVVQILEGFVDVTIPPIPRTLQNLSANKERVVFFSDFSSQSSKVPSSTNQPCGIAE